MAYSGWAGVAQLVSPWSGVLYPKLVANNRMNRFLDIDPADGSGADVYPYPTDPVSTSGWSRVLLSARPDTVTVQF